MSAATLKTIPCPDRCGGDMPAERLTLGYTNCGPCNTADILARRQRAMALDSDPAPSNNFGKGSWT
jgi:hypothetical protein